MVDTMIHKISRQGLCWDLYRNCMQHTDHIVEQLGWDHIHKRPLSLSFWSFCLGEAGVTAGCRLCFGRVLLREKANVYDRLRTYYSIPTSLPKP